MLKDKNKIEVLLPDYKNAPDGSLLVKEKGVWKITSFKELNKENEEELKQLPLIKQEITNVKEYQKHFKVYAKSHFLVVFNLFLSKVINGDIDCDDDEILTLDSKVIQGEISVENAIEKHEYLKTTFESVFNDRETIEFPEV